ncbi:hypothetical protein R5M92_16135 (plasmid) [Halomonas sp. Bachu 37]|uniref:hypothetical protein n=1 Tax=Halomonas kashgarensis TaxID=3084920 RepID=UPI003216806B
MLEKNEGWKRLWIAITSVWLAISIPASIYALYINAPYSRYSRIEYSSLFEVLAGCFFGVFGPPVMAWGLAKLFIWVFYGFCPEKKPNKEI